MQSPWNSLEVVKLIVSSSIPIVVAVFGYILNRSIKRIDRKQWTNQKILEKRLVVYDKIVPILNDLFCYHCYIGNWKEISAKKVVENKRILDKEVNIYAPLFPNELLPAYRQFMVSYYETNTGWGKDARINSLYTRREEFSSTWDDNDKQFFSQDYVKRASVERDAENTYISEKKRVYFDIIDCLSRSLEIMQSSGNRDIGNPNINFHHE